MVRSTSGRLVSWELCRQYSDEFLVEYENEDQLDYLIDKTGKPMVVLYCIGSDSSLWHDRKMMRKYSHKCRDKANFTIVNIAQHLMYINAKRMRFPDPDNLRLQVRRPKQKVIASNAKGEAMELEGVHVYKPFVVDNTEGCWQAFLESEGILTPKDPAQNLLAISLSTVFS